MSKLLVVAIGLVAAAATSGHGQTTLETLNCYKVNDSTPHTRFTARVGSAGNDQSCIFKTPARLGCVATTSDVTPPPAGTAGGSTSGQMLCYQAKCQGPSPLGSQGLQDAFGSRAVTFRGARFVCIPAESAPNVTTTTVQNGGTTSTTVQATGCHFSNGKCTGSCGPGGGTCGAAVGTGSCECRQKSCGDADAPTCDGACSNPGDACVFDITGCSCVSIP